MRWLFRDDHFKGVYCVCTRCSHSGGAPTSPSPPSQGRLRFLLFRSPDVSLFGAAIWVFTTFGWPLRRGKQGCTSRKHVFSPLCPTYCVLCVQSRDKPSAESTLLNWTREATVKKKAKANSPKVWRSWGVARTERVYGSAKCVPLPLVYVTSVFWLERPALGVWVAGGDCPVFCAGMQFVQWGPGNPHPIPAGL